MIIFKQEEDQDVRDSGDFSKFRLSEETVEALKGWFYSCPSICESNTCIIVY